MQFGQLRIGQRTAGQSQRALQHALCPAADWRVLAYEDGFLTPPDRFVQRIAAVRLGEPVGDAPPRYPL